MHKLDIAVGLLYLPVCFVIGYTTANLKLCQRLCTPPPPPPRKSNGEMALGWKIMSRLGLGLGVGCGYFTCVSKTIH